jgi:predicted nuclease of predicted toxin-antitoxin system
LTLSLYMDVNVAGPITRGLRQRGVTVVTAQEDGASQLPDPDVMDRAMLLDSVVFTHDPDFLAEATRRQRAGEDFSGLFYCHQLRAQIGRCIADLELLAKALDPPDMKNRVEYLPL